MKTKIAMAVALCAGICAVAPSAQADPPRREEGYAYEFKDDGLMGKDMIGDVPILKVRNQGRRDLLHRPRLQFVQEMLKSVENM